MLILEFRLQCSGMLILELGCSIQVRMSMSECSQCSGLLVSEFR